MGRGGAPFRVPHTHRRAGISQLLLRQLSLCVVVRRERPISTPDRVVFRRSHSGRRVHGHAGVSMDDALSSRHVVSWRHADTAQRIRVRHRADRLGGGTGKRCSAPNDRGQRRWTLVLASHPRPGGDAIQLHGIGRPGPRAAIDAFPITAGGLPLAPHVERWNWEGESRAQLGDSRPRRALASCGDDPVKRRSVTPASASAPPIE
jgi:hypothetical protein